MNEDLPRSLPPSVWTKLHEIRNADAGPVDGEPAGDACAICGVTPRWKQYAKGWRIEDTHDRAAHEKGAQRDLELRPPRRPRKDLDD